MQARGCRAETWGLTARRARSVGREDSLGRPVGGELQVTSTPGAGSVFTLRLPARTAATPAYPDPTTGRSDDALQTA